jgi:hypothetical protein
MIVNEEHEVSARATPLEVVWRNPLPRIREYLRAREANDPHYKWAEQGSKIRARRQRVPPVKGVLPVKKVSGISFRLALRRLFFHPLS